MNGRVYDPVLGRFLSADPLVQAPYFSQSYNRYTYTFNNPLSWTDPSGYGSAPATEHVVVTGTPSGGSGGVTVHGGGGVSFSSSPSAGGSAYDTFNMRLDNASTVDELADVADDLADYYEEDFSDAFDGTSGEGRGSGSGGITVIGQRYSNSIWGGYSGMLFAGPLSSSSVRSLANGAGHSNTVLSVKGLKDAGDLAEALQASHEYVISAAQGAIDGDAAAIAKLRDLAIAAGVNPNMHRIGLAGTISQVYIGHASKIQANLGKLLLPNVVAGYLSFAAYSSGPLIALGLEGAGFAVSQTSLPEINVTSSTHTAKDILGR